MNEKITTIIVSFCLLGGGILIGAAYTSYRGGTALEDSKTEVDRIGIELETARQSNLELRGINNEFRTAIREREEIIDQLNNAADERERINRELRTKMAELTILNSGSTDILVDIREEVEAIDDIFDSYRD